jgi:hypothetical protein
MKALGRLIGSMEGHDRQIKLHNLLLDSEQFSAARGKARASSGTPVCRFGQQQHAAVP